MPVEGNEVMVNGKPIGNCTGDGFGMLQAHNMAGMQTPTHQWTLTDPLVVPVLHLMPELLKGMRNQDETCLKVHNALIRYLQIFFAEIESRRRHRQSRWTLGANCKTPSTRPVHGRRQPRTPFTYIIGVTHHLGRLQPSLDLRTVLVQRFLPRPAI